MRLRKLIHDGATACLGVFAGAMLFIATGLMPYWSSLSPESYRAQFQAVGPSFGAVMVPLLVLSIFLAGCALFLCRGQRLSWTIAFCAVLAIVPLYGAIHAPVNTLILGTTDLANPSVEALRSKWFLWHWVRTILGLIATGAAVYAHGRSEPKRAAHG